MKFWDKVDQCKHENLSYYYNSDITCTTPYCSAREDHCLDCGVYISECQCQSSSGMSGWSNQRWRSYWKKKYGRRAKTN